jgi:hypothetical protein
MLGHSCGFDVHQHPSAPSSAEMQAAQQSAADQAGHAKGGRARGAARRAVGGAAISAIAGNAGAGAAAGAVAGTMRGGRRQPIDAELVRPQGNLCRRANPLIAFAFIALSRSAPAQEFLVPHYARSRRNQSELSTMPGLLTSREKRFLQNSTRPHSSARNQLSRHSAKCC